ncbi:50S ribosomal protein L11 methyltransferase [Pontiella agarivorans]|uniref:50S ribosomal protein L11 methyltransferase n=1 Tax=Pontiella agarivorans TaxID=3038953 RepID=A0ABU5MV39_9BACT|nr:50S ribosomal protein L11 methyltransferase [Pontiella agarivorans]MDZ8118079.1 50S ribosomal protein L11 methyltransferase [Pontiella agarivorans]
MKEKNKNCGGQLNLLVPAEHAERICEWVRDALGKEPIEVSHPHAERAQIEIYFDSLVEAQLVQKALPADLIIEHAEAKEYKEQDWTTFWQHHFKIMELGRNLRIVPEWEPVPEDDKINIIINPGLSFGTGGHFTTKFCLEALEASLQSMEINTMIDAGTGSGILSIAAVKLGIPDIVAFDYDPVCVDQCNLNAARNGVEGKIHFFQADVLQPGWNAKPADLICANILTSVLLEAAPLLKRAANKRLLLSGIREIEADAVAGTFMELGCKEVSRDGDGKWCGMIIDV